MDPWVLHGYELGQNSEQFPTIFVRSVSCTNSFLPWSLKLFCEHLSANIKRKQIFIGRKNSWDWVSSTARQFQSRRLQAKHSDIPVELA